MMFDDWLMEEKKVRSGEVKVPRCHPTLSLALSASATNITRTLKSCNP